MSTQTIPIEPPIPPLTAAPEHQMSIMTIDGDIKVQWDRRQSEEVATAKQAYDAWIAKGYSAYKTKADGTEGEVLQKFDADAERIILRKRIVGG